MLQDGAAKMGNEIIYFLGFCVIVANFLFLFPFYIGLNASTNLDKSFSSIDVKTYMFKIDRFLIALLSIGVFAVSLFVFEEGAIAIVLGAIILAVFVILDYKRIYQGNRNISDVT
jgi:uncharacterized membrane protein